MGDLPIDRFGDLPSERVGGEWLVQERNAGLRTPWSTMASSV